MSVWGHVLEIAVHIDPEEGSYERRVYSLLDMTGQLGGLYEIFEVFGGIIVGFFTERLLMFSLMSRLYQVEKPANPNVTKYQDNSSPMAFEPSSKNLENYDFAMRDALRKKHLNRLNKVTSKRHTIQAIQQKVWENKHSYWRTLKEAMVKRRRYAYSAYDYLYSLICCP